MVPSVGTHSLRSERYLIIDDFVYNDSPRRTAVLMGDAGRATCCCRDGGRGEGGGTRQQAGAVSGNLGAADHSLLVMLVIPVGRNSIKTPTPV